jgi:hypothetical protein
MHVLRPSRVIHSVIGLPRKNAWTAAVFVVAWLLIAYAIGRLLVSGIGIVEGSPTGQPQPELVYHVAQGLDPDAREFAIAQMALPVVLVSEREEFSQGEFGVVYQVDSTTPQEIEDAFHIQVESDRELIYVLFAFIFAEDRDPQSARVTLANSLYIDFNHRAVSVFGWIHRGIRDGHQGDIENLLLVYESDSTQPNENLRLIVVAPKQHTNGFEEIPLEHLNVNDEGRLVFNAQEEKNTLSENERRCQNLNVAEYLGLISVNGFGCYPPHQAEALDIQILDSHNVGEWHERRNPLAISPLLREFSDLDVWAERPDGPFGEGRAFFEWLR